MMKREISICVELARTHRIRRWITKTLRRREGEKIGGFGWVPNPNLGCAGGSNWRPMLLVDLVK